MVVCKGIVGARIGERSWSIDRGAGSGDDEDTQSRGCRAPILSVAAAYPCFRGGDPL